MICCATPRILRGDNSKAWPSAGSGRKDGKNSSARPPPRAAATVNPQGVPAAPTPSRTQRGGAEAGIAQRYLPVGSSGPVFTVGS